MSARKISQRKGAPQAAAGEAGILSPGVRGPHRANKSQMSGARALGEPTVPAVTIETVEFVRSGRPYRDGSARRHVADPEIVSGDARRSVVMPYGDRGLHQPAARVPPARVAGRFDPPLIARSIRLRAHVSRNGTGNAAAPAKPFYGEDGA